MGNIIIFEHPVGVYDYAPSVDLYRIRDKRLFDLSIYFDLKSFMPLFNTLFEQALKSECPVITIPYNPVSAKVVEVTLDKYFHDVIENWRMVSFFHDDTGTAMISLPNGEAALEQKFVLIKTMLEYPNIKKLEIPYKATITPSLLNTLFEE